MKGAFSFKFDNSLLSNYVPYQHMINIFEYVRLSFLDKVQICGDCKLTHYAVAYICVISLLDNKQVQ